MPNSVRVGDKARGFGTHGLSCCGHIITGVFTQGSPTVFHEGRASVRVGDRGVTNCPHCTLMWASSGSSSVFDDGKPTHRVGDTVNFPCGRGTTQEGSSRVIEG